MRMSLLRFGLTAGSLVLALASASQVRAGNGIIDEVKLGFLAADTGIGGSKDENGLDINGEVLFTAPQLFVSPNDPVWLSISWRRVPPSGSQPIPPGGPVSST